jgi:hypothetical protein
MRKILERVALGLLIACGLAWVAYPMIQEQLSCTTSFPTNAAQRLALKALKSRKAAECEGPGKGCLYLIGQDDDGSIQISFNNIHGAEGSACSAMDFDWELYFFDARGVYARCVGCAA